jgi:hypothetical protein
MFKENFHGSNNRGIDWSDRSPGAKALPAELGRPENTSAHFQNFEADGEEAWLDIHNSNARLDAYLFHFSSKL